MDLIKSLYNLKIDKGSFSKEAKIKLILIYLFGTVIAFGVGIPILVVAMDFTVLETIYFFSVITIAAIAVMLSADISALLIIFKPIEKFINISSDQNFIPPENIVIKAITRTLNLPLITLIRVSTLHPVSFLAGSFIAMVIGNNLFSMNFKPVSYISLIFVTFLAAIFHAVQEYFSVTKFIKPIVLYINNKTGIQPEKYIKKIKFIKTNQKLLLIYILIALLPFFIFIMLSVLKIYNYINSGMLLDNYKLIFKLIPWICVFSISMIITTFYATYLLSQEISGNINTMGSLMKNVENGILKKHLEIVSGDEFYNLYSSYNDMIYGLKNLTAKLKIACEAGKTIGYSLASNSKSVSGSSNNIQKNMQVYNEKNISLDNRIKNSLVSILEIKELIDNITKKIEHQNSSISESTNSMNQIIDSINKSALKTKDKQEIITSIVNVANKGKNEMNITLESIREITVLAGNIAEMIMAINQIAGTTNMLAMNAAIEAAHAGEAGKGFAVVADEIRNLAEQSAENAKNISASLDAILKKITNTKEVSEKTGESINKMIIDINDVLETMKNFLVIMQNMSKESTEITGCLLKLKEISNEVNNSSAVINSKSNDTLDFIKTVEMLSNENLTNMTQISDDIKNINKAIIDILELGNRNSENITQLDNELNKFKIE